MSHPSQGRWLAPLALLAALVAVGVIVASTAGGGSGDSASSPSPVATTGEEEPRFETQPRTQTSTQPRTGTTSTTSTTSTTGAETYTVQSGDTLGTIAEETGVSVAELQELNPGVDPQSLTVGQRLRLAPR